MNPAHAPPAATILLVDDLPDNLHLLSRMLSRQGYCLQIATSGEVAIASVERHPPDLILLDIMMPGMDGYEVCQHLKANPSTRDIPVIFLSALNESSDRTKAFTVGGADYIAKPFQIQEVLVRVENQLTLRQVQVELRQAKVEALNALEQEKELNRLKSEFIAMVSHDFRNPLASIQAFAELLQQSKQVLTPETQARYFDKINAAVEHMLCLLDEVLLIGGIDLGKVQCQPRPLNLEQFCRNLIEMLQVNLQERHRLYFSCTGESVEAEVDPTLLHQILSNLLANAVKYSPAGSQVLLDLTLQAEVTVFQIKDQGIGIPSENQPRLFETFFRGSNVGQTQGTGLGLAIVKRCVDAHQGSIEVKSEEGVGTIVTVTLPLSQRLS